MAYLYNAEKIKEFAQEREMGGRTIANKLNMSNDKAPRGWLAGNKQIRMDHFLNFVNTFKLDLLDFFTQDGSPLSKAQNNAQTTENTLCSVSESVAELKIAHIQAMADMEKEHLREMMQKDIDLAQKELLLNEKIRKQLKAEFADDKQQIIDSYEARLTERDKLIGQLQQQVAELTAAQEPKTVLGYTGITGVAERGYDNNL